MNRPILPYMDFSGGLNTTVSNEKLQDSEMTILQNVDLSSRGSAKRRTGRTKIGSIPGTGQGLFFFYRGESDPDLIASVSGKLYVKPFNSNTFTEIVIKNLDNSTFTFQNTLPIEAVQYRKVLFVATGTKLVEVTWDGTAHQANVMSPYKPTVLEVINIGTNAIADNPNTWIQEKTDSVVSIEGVTTSIPQGAVNTSVTFTAHVKKPANINVNYSFSWRKTGSGAFTEVKTDSPDSFADITFNDVGGYDIKVDTKQVLYPIDNIDAAWSGAQASYVQQASTGMYDGVSTDSPCLIITNPTNGPYNSSDPAAWKDFSTPVDMTKANTVEWRWWSYNPYNETMPANWMQLAFYTEGNLATPVLTVGNTGGESTFSIGGQWHKQVSPYDNAIAGLDKIVRMAFISSALIGDTYVPNTTGTQSTSDRSTRLDKIMMYESNTETTYTLSNYQIVGVTDPKVDPETYSAIHSSRLIRLHWDRLILGKDNKYPGQLYVSDLNNPRYFPTNKRIDFSLDRQEPITSVVRFQDFLVIFTKTTISTLTGTHPQDGDVMDGREYRVSLINDTLGCIADKSAKVVNNSIVFLSSDGLHRLTPNMYQLQNLEPVKWDLQVKSDIDIDENACAIVHDEQYYLCFPVQKKILRNYFNFNQGAGAWVEDLSTKLNITQFAYYNSNVYNLTTDGNVYLQDPTVYADDNEIYDMTIQSKYIDLQAVFNFKKLKRLFVLANYYKDHTVDLYTKVWADAQIALDPTTGHTEVVDGYVKWVSETKPNMHFYSGTELGTWVMGQAMFGDGNIFINEAKIRGKCRRVKVSFTHSQATPCEIYGFGVEFSYKSPGRRVGT